jgi:hypothetical protein
MATEAESNELTPEIEAALKALAARSFAPGATTEAPPVEAAPEPQQPEPQPPPPPEQPPQQNDAAEALRRQIEALNQAQIVREQAEQQAAIAQQAAYERRQAWLETTRGAKDHREALGHIHRAALEAGFVDTSPEYFQFLESQLAILQQPAEEPKPTPKFFKPPPARSAPNPSSLVSAPVSRNIPSGSTGKRSSPGRITLTPSEVEAAKMSNVSIEEYARQKIEYERQRQSGEYRDNRDQR